MTSVAQLDDKYDFVLMTRNHLPGALQVAEKSYFVDEGISKAVKLLESIQATQEILDLMSQIAEDGVSVVSVEKATDTVVGVIFSKMRVQSQNEKNFYQIHMDNCKHPSSKLWVKVMNDVSTSCDLFKTYQTDCIFESVLAAVLPAYRNERILKRLSVYTMEIARSLSTGKNVKMSLDLEPLALGPTPGVLGAVATSSITQYVALSFGFEIAASIDYSCYSYGGDSFDKIVGSKPTSMMMVCLPLTKTGNI